jgi:hypothetical protein
MKQNQSRLVEEPTLGDLIQDAPGSMFVAGELVENMVGEMLHKAWEKDVLNRHLK